MTVRTRFAPSPTGSLHLGNARIAVLNWLFARRHGGVFVLRIEDTDVDRNVAGAERQLLEDLCWLGLDWDEGPDPDGGERGGYGPYRQSERLERYAREARRLDEEGHAYACYCTARELEARREQALAEGRAPHYDGACRDLAAADTLRLRAEGRTPALRFRVPEDGDDVVVHDVVRGAVRFPRADIGDFILLRSDGRPTYNFAAVVDDAAMEITHVIRGVGHLSNTPRQQLLYEALARPAPVFAHAPTVLGPDRQKLSKRHGAQPLADYRRQGYHPDAVVNYLSLLAWSSPSGDEVLERARLVNEISLERVRAADVVFDAEKMRWLSAQHIARMPLAELVDAVLPWIDRDRHPLPDEVLPVAVDAVRSHLSTFADIDEPLDPFVPTLDEAGRRRRAALAGDARARAVLDAARAALDAAAWDEAALKRALQQASSTSGARGAELYVPLRIALTGREHGPPMLALLVVLGRAATLRLLREAAGDVV